MMLPDITRKKSKPKKMKNNRKKEIKYKKTVDNRSQNRVQSNLSRR